MRIVRTSCGLMCYGWTKRASEGGSPFENPFPTPAPSQSRPCTRAGPRSGKARTCDTALKIHFSRLSISLHLHHFIFISRTPPPPDFDYSISSLCRPAFPTTVTSAALHAPPASGGSRRRESPRPKMHTCIVVCCSTTIRLREGLFGGWMALQRSSSHNSHHTPARMPAKSTLDFRPSPRPQVLYSP